MTKRSILQYIFIALIISCLTAGAAFAQDTAFTYQGKLNISGTPASGTYEMQFQLFDSVKGGSQIGATVTDPNVAVVNGVFTTTLDFGAAAFDGSPRFLETGVRSAGNPDPFTILAPRQQVKSAPYSIQSRNSATADALSANCVNCVTSGQIQSVDGGQVTGVLPTNSIPTGSDNYIQNAAVALGKGKDGGQPAARINIGGNATVGSLDVNGPASFAAIGAPALAPAGQGRIYFDSATNKVKVSENGGAFVNLVGATGVSGSGTVNTIPLFSAGTTLGNSVLTQSGTNIGMGTPTPAHRLSIIGLSPAWTSAFWGGALELANSNAIGWRANAGGQRFGLGQSNGGLFFFRTASDPGNSQFPTTNDMVINDVGSVGIGTTTPPVGVKLDVSGTVRSIQPGGNISLSSPNGETGMSIAGTNRADVRFDGVTLKLFAGTGVTPPGNGITIGTSGGATVTGSNGDGATITARRSVGDPFIIIDATTVSNNAVLAFRKNNFNRWLMFADNAADSGGSTGSDFRLDAYNNAGGIGTRLFVQRSTGNVGIGTITPVAKLHVIGTTRTSVVEVTGGSDLAEKFSFSEQVKPGMVVAIDPQNAGKLMLSRGSYNRRVAGIISGANNLSAGMVLPDVVDGNSAHPVALSGRVWVYCDATKGAIKPGNLLTTSTTPGYAMKAVNHSRAQGAIIGKAMTELKSGTGLVLVLVTLQ